MESADQRSLELKYAPFETMTLVICTSDSAIAHFELWKELAIASAVVILSMAIRLIDRRKKSLEQLPRPRSADEF